MIATFGFAVVELLLPAAQFLELAFLSLNDLKLALKLLFLRLVAFDSRHRALKRFFRQRTKNETRERLLFEMAALERTGLIAAPFNAEQSLDQLLSLLIHCLEARLPFALRELSLPAG